MIFLIHFPLSFGFSIFKALSLFSCTFKLFSYVSFHKFESFNFLMSLIQFDTLNRVQKNEAEIHFNSFEWRQSITLILFIGIVFVSFRLHLACLVPGAACQVFVIGGPYTSVLCTITR